MRQVVNYSAVKAWTAMACLGMSWVLCGLPARGADETSWPVETSLFELPEGFAQQIVAEGFTGATSMALVPDGSILVCQQTGELRLIAGGRLRDEPVLKLDVDSYWERGLIGITLDPRINENGFVYLCYVAPQPYPHHRVSRFVLTDDRIEAASERILWRGDDQSKLGGAIPAGHQGGAIRFGLDGKLYIALGEQTAGAPSQRLDTFQGKLLRINSDGSIPADNPFSREAQGNYRAIFARGLRNPFMMAVHPVSGRIFLNDVGGSRWEEINEAQPGANFGWPVGEGPAPNRGSTGEYAAPVFAYAEAAKQSIAGGAFYTPKHKLFPTAYRGRYFFADYMLGWIRSIGVEGQAGQAASAALPFAANLPGPVDIQVADDGSMYVLCRNAWVKDAKFQPNTGSLHRIVYRGQDGDGARIAKQPADVFVAEGEAARFAIDAAGKDARFRWQRNGKWIGGGDSRELQMPLVRREDDGARVRCVMKSADGFVMSKAARLRVVKLREPAQVDEVAPGLRDERQDSGISFRGLVKIESSATYTFYVSGSGAAKLYIAGQEVAAKGKTAGIKEASGVIGLKPGLHPLRVDVAKAEAVPRLPLEVSSAELSRGQLNNQQLVHAVRGAPDVREPAPISPTVFVPQLENELPEKLSETGIFRSLRDLTASQGVIEYDVNSPLWSDGAEKRRWMIVPAGGRIEWSEDEVWRFPAGTVFVKHFELGGQRLETRLLVVDRDGLGYGATYKWRADGLDADLLADGFDERLAGLTWSYPSRKQCLVCHTPHAGFVLGVNMRQLNRKGADGENQLVRLSRLKVMARTIEAEEISQLPRLAAIDDESQSLELRARSYLDSNCAQCHQPGGVRAEFDARFRTPLAKQNLDGKLVAADLGVSVARPIFAGQPEKSMILLRMERREDVFNMPPLASHVVDEKAVDVFRRWISGFESKQRVDKGR